MRFGFGPGFGNVSSLASAASDAIVMVQRVLVASAPKLTGGVYDPATDPDVVAWFDPSDASAITQSGGSATALKNKKSAVSWAAVSSCPYEATGLNGHPCLHPTTISHYFLSTEAAVVAALNCPTTAKPYTIYIVEAADSVTAGGVLVGAGNSGVSSASTRTWGRRATINQYEYQQTSPATATNARSATGAITTSMAICAWHSPGVGQKMSLNNAADDPGNTTVDPSYTPGTGPNRVALFCRPDLAPDSPVAAKVGEIIIVGDEHDAAKRAQVYDYLLARWS